MLFLVPGIHGGAPASVLESSVHFVVEVRIVFSACKYFNHDFDDIMCRYVGFFHFALLFC